MRVNSYPEGNIPNNVTLNVTVNCSCGNKDVSKDYGLFITYLMRPGENLASIALATNTSSELIEKYNPMVNFSASSGLLYITGRGLSGIHVDKSVEFSYEELAESTNDFSISNKIGEGGFVAVYYAELRGKKAAIKRMNRQRRTEFLAELKILVRVHHLNLIGDFGLAKLVKSGNPTLPSRFLGTFGYMPPEKQVKEDGVDEPRSLVALFDEAHSHPNQNEGISRLIDPKLGNNYPIDSVYKMAQLAKACTEKDPQMRPTMKSVVVALMALSSLTED
ncbi:hypothetical protein K7X08_036284 [Anisodus acutangulus]|uniref:Protein kinase domain-containing protein n=1 Tax=Anisodus acutangulus TaxID=402998 RepID=A0A9Q1QVR8_9SOLA|nr:hypothetical protein K7X08_036284 [Anisodus acutangulus]